MAKDKSKTEPWYIAQRPIDHDGRRYDIGETVPVTGDAAAALLAVGAVTKAGESGEG